MSDNITNLASDFEGEISSVPKMKTSLDSHLPPFNHGRLEPEVIPLFDDSNSPGYLGIL